MFVIVGLGNPGKEYEMTRHNVGRIVLNYFSENNNFPDWKSDKKFKALVSEGEVGKNKVLLMEPETFMNKSGLSLKNLITNNKKAESLVVIYDDLDLPFGEFKIAFNRGSGGHKGLESIIKTIKTKEFVRIRVGVCPVTPTSKMKKPKGEEKVLNFIMKNFNKTELEVLEKVSKKASESLEMIIKKDRAVAMNKFN